MNAAVAYLETDTEYLEIAWEQGIPYTLVDLRDAFGADFPSDECACDESDYLCTGDGFRWTPWLPELRFA